MALEKREGIKQIEVDYSTKIVFVEKETWVEEDGVMIGSKKAHRHCVVPGQSYGDEATEVQSVCAALHTADAIAAFEALSSGD